MRTGPRAGSLKLGSGGNIPLESKWVWPGRRWAGRERGTVTPSEPGWALLAPLCICPGGPTHRYIALTWQLSHSREHHGNHWKALKADCGPSSVSDSVGLEWAQGICTPNMFARK